MTITISTVRTTPAQSTRVDYHYHLTGPDTRINIPPTFKLVGPDGASIPNRGECKLHRWKQNCHIILPVGWVFPGRCNVWRDGADLAFEQNEAGRYSVSALTTPKLHVKITIPSSIARTLKEGQACLPMHKKDDLLVVDFSGVISEPKFTN